MKFTKMHGIANDYVVLNGVKDYVRNPGKAAKELCDRRFGIGADGLLLVLPGNGADFRMRMFNPDGSEAEMCGNGIRCFGKFVYDHGLTGKKRITVSTLGGTKTLDFAVSGGAVTSVKVDMGEPKLERPEIPMVGKGRAVNEIIKVSGRQLLCDEAHSFGVLGPNGRGLADEAGLEADIDFVVGTFSKSVGAIGGFGAGDHPLFDCLRYAMRPYMFTASSSPASIATSLAAIRILAAEPQRRQRLGENSARLFNGFKALGLDLGCNEASPVVAVKCRDETSTIAMWNALLKSGVYVNIALPPGTPNKLCLLRCSVSAAHSDADIDRIIELFGTVAAQGHGNQATANKPPIPAADQPQI